MKSKVLIIIAIIFFVIVMIILSKYLNNMNNSEISNNQESKLNDGQIEIIEVTSDNFEEEVLNSSKTVVIDFYADWCQPCKVYSPIIEEFAKENENIKIVKVDVDNSEDLAIKYHAISIPTTVIIKDGKEVNRVVGIVSKSDLEQILQTD